MGRPPRRSLLRSGSRCTYGMYGTDVVYAGTSTDAAYAVNGTDAVYVAIRCGGSASLGQYHISVPQRAVGFCYAWRRCWY
eukprot:1464983-Rhodomonas_salina.2